MHSSDIPKGHSVLAISVSVIATGWLNLIRWFLPYFSSQLPSTTTKRPRANKPFAASYHELYCLYSLHFPYIFKSNSSSKMMTNGLSSSSNRSMGVRGITSKERAYTPPCADSAETGELTQRRLQQEQRYPTQHQEQQIGHKKHSCWHNKSTTYFMLTQALPWSAALELVDITLTNNNIVCKSDQSYHKLQQYYDRLYAICEHFGEDRVIVNDEHSFNTKMCSLHMQR